MEKRMNEKEFWDFIESAKINNESDASNISDMLEELGYEKAVDFALHFENILDVLDTSTNAYAFGALIKGSPCSDDGWLYFRSWLIYQGKDIVTKAMKDPDALMDVYDKYKTRKKIFGEYDTEDYLSIWFNCFDEEIMDDIDNSTIYGQETFCDDSNEIDWEVTTTELYFKEHMPRLWEKFSKGYKFS